MNLPGWDTVGAVARVLASLLRTPHRETTLDSLRSDLSHETAAKFTRLAGLGSEWQQGRLRAGDADDALAIVRDLERLHLRHGRLACARFGTCARQFRILARLAALRRTTLRLRAGGAPPAAAAAGFLQQVTQLRSESRLLCAAITDRLAVRFGEVAAAAVGEIRREISNDDRVAVTLNLQDGAEGTGDWVPRRDAGAWADLLRNFLRNAVAATLDSGTGAGVVTLRLLPPADGRGCAVEIVDDGVGMSPATRAAMWEAGAGTHGKGRGQGLTPAKLAFLQRRARLAVRSREGAGTELRLDLPHRDLAIATPRLWSLPPLTLPAAALIGLALLGWSATRQPVIVSAGAAGPRVLCAYDAGGSRLWQCDLGADIVPNFLRPASDPRPSDTVVDPPLVVTGAGPADSRIVVATEGVAGPGGVVCLDGRGRTRWSRTLAWEPPAPAYTGALVCVFVARSVWNDDGRPLLVLNVRDQEHSATALQFLDVDGVRLGAYHHPGHLEWDSSSDLDGDGRTEILLRGFNNDAGTDTLFLADEPPPGFYAPCLLLLETPEVAGQAYPYRGWRDLPPAREQAYLLIPPLDSYAADDLRIEKVNCSSPAAPGGARLEVVVQDGRVYELDAELRPLACRVGDNTRAARLAPLEALGPLVHLRRGVIEYIRVPVRREPT
ncbi:MAG: ATP-binding protein [bacterium]|nr:ATP-binding protein [bacterium]